MEYKTIKLKMFELGLTYADVSEKIGISKFSFTKKVNGKTRFSVDEAAKLSKILKLTNDEVVNIFFS